MERLLIVNSPANWSLALPGVKLVSARAYVTDPRFEGLRHARVFNMVRSHRYQSLGYYVSLLAEARGHRPQPSVVTIQDLKSPSLVRFYGEELEELIRHSLAPIKSDAFEISVYFGRNMTARYDRLCLALYNLFPAPLLRARFAHDREGGWRMADLSLIGIRDVPDSHREFVTEAAARFFQRRRARPKARPTRYDVAILYDPKEELPPSDEVALGRFVRAARRLGLEAELITREDFGRLAEFDALFIRETTSVNHHTFRFARRAAAEGLAVIDDPESILRCGNKVFLAELLERHGVRGPRTVIVHRDNVDEVERLGLPCILKKPDSAFSQGVARVDRPEQLRPALAALLEDSDLVIAQEFVPTGFDWRIGVLDRQALYACRYHMAHRHWQIVRSSSKGTQRFGRVEAVPLEEAPRSVVRAAVKAANLIGDGLYGVDVKHVGRRAYVIEVNDNPSIDAGNEDRVLGKALYERILESLVRRVERRRLALR